MKLQIFKFSLLFLIVFFINPMLAQDKSDIIKRSKYKDSSYFSLNLSFISDAIYLGRKDSITAPYLNPSIIYHNKSGFYAIGSFSYLTKSDQSRIDLFLGSIGYDFTSKNLSGDFSITKYFFNTDSYNVISEVDADITASIKYDFDLLYLSASSTYFIAKSSSSDIFLSTEIGHDFVSSTKDFQLSPSIGVYFGSQNFYEEYYINNRFGSARTGSGSGTGQGTGGTTPTTTTTVIMQESEKFDLMAIEFSLPIWYINKPFIISFLPVIVVPQNPATLTVDSVVHEEDLETTFYWMAGISYRF
jgi:hypothetical protein